MMPLSELRDDTKGERFAHPSSHCVEIGAAPGMIVADFGSGSGVHAFALAEAIGAQGRVYAIDVQRDLLMRIKNEAKRRRVSHIDILWGDLETPGGSKVADERADIVLLSNILFQLADRQVALREARRILKAGGVCAVIERSGAAGLYPEGVLSKEALYELARVADFEPSREFDAGSHHWGIILRPIAPSTTQTV